MDWQHLLFSFDGRINRAKYWLVAAISLAVLVIAALLSSLLLVTVPALGWLLLAAVFLPAIYIAVAVGVKRLHDRNKSGWWLLLFYFVPGSLQGLAGDGFSGFGIILNLIGLAISLWALVELGILRGTVGPNDYGSDPLEGKT